LGIILKLSAFHILLALSMGLLSSGAFAESACDIAFDDGKDQVNFEVCRSQAESGDKNSQFGYAQILMFGVGREHHAEKSLVWYRQSARQRNLLAQVVLGRMLSDKESGVVLNEPEAYAWWSASKQVDSAAKLWSRLSKKQQLKAKILAEEYVANYVSSK
jgi:TPR repeat protein